jgi:hypothetical protein
VGVFFPNPAFKMRDIALQESHQAPYLGFAVPSILTLPPAFSFVLGGLSTSVYAGLAFSTLAVPRLLCFVLPAAFLPDAVNDLGSNDLEESPLSRSSFVPFKPLVGLRLFAFFSSLSFISLK